MIYLNGVHVGVCNTIALMNFKYDNESFEYSAFTERETFHQQLAQ